MPEGHTRLTTRSIGRDWVVALRLSRLSTCYCNPDWLRGFEVDASVSVVTLVGIVLIVAGPTHFFHLGITGQLRRQPNLGDPSYRLFPQLHRTVGNLLDWRASLLVTA